MNFAAGQTVANSVIVPIGPDGKITVRNGSWDRADVVADVVGYYSTDSRSALVSIGGPYRIMDTRKDSWGGRKAGPIPARTFLPVRLDGDTTNSDIDGWVLNTTVTNTTGTGFLSVAADPNTWPDYLKGTAVTPQRPVSSSLNWTAGATVPNLVQTSGGKGAWSTSGTRAGRTSTWSSTCSAGTRRSSSALRAASHCTLHTSCAHRNMGGRCAIADS